MKKTFAIFFSSVLFLLTVQKVQAQKTTFSVYGGPNFSTFYSTTNGAGNFKSVAGFDFGFAVQIPYRPDFYFQPGICFDTKGSTLPSGTKVKKICKGISV